MNNANLGMLQPNNYVVIKLTYVEMGYAHCINIFT